MKVLLTNHALSILGGSETATITLAKELISQGHSVDVFTYELGEASKKIEEFGGKIIDKISDDYDLAIVNHNSTLIQVPPSIKTVFISHGVIPTLEAPIEGASKYVAVSEEVQNELSRMGFESTILRNAVDKELFNIKKPINEKLKNVLLLSNHLNYSSPQFQAYKNACDELGVSLNVVGLGFGINFDQNTISDLINEHDVIITLGRGVPESLSCGRPVIVSDYAYSDGFHSYGYPSFGEYCNFSGRSNKFAITKEHIKNELLRYDNLVEQYGVEKMMEENRKMANDIKEYTNNLLNTK